MLVLSVFAAIGASTGWATGIVLAHEPARALGSFEFTRVQLLACAAILALLCALSGYWQTVAWHYWPFFAASIFSVLLGNLAMIGCLRRGGPRRTQLLLSLRGPAVAALAFVWLGEALSFADVLGAAVVLAGIGLAIQFGSNGNSDSERISGGLGAVVLLGLAATACQGFGFLVMKPAMQAGTEPLAASAIRLAGAAFVISVTGLWPAQAFRPNRALTPKLLGQTILPGFLGYGVSSSLLLYAFANSPAGVAAVLGSLAPVLVLPILWVRERRSPKPQAVAGAMLAVLGTTIIVLL